jgi:hypothetical protein
MVSAICSVEPLTIYNIYYIIILYYTILYYILLYYIILYYIYIYIISYDYVRNIVRHEKHSERNVKSGTTLESADFLLATVESRRCKLHSNRIRTMNSPRHRRYNMSTPIRIRESPHQPSQIISNSLNSSAPMRKKKSFCHATQRRNTRRHRRHLNPLSSLLPPPKSFSVAAIRRAALEGSS